LREGTPKKVIGFKQKVQAIFVESAAKEGVSLLLDI
jgi:Niemann-Pick C1 protein